MRAEVHASGSAFFPPAGLRALTRAVVRKGLLTPIAVVITERRRLEVTDQASADRIEVDDDRVWSVVGLRRGPTFHQIEIEATSPNADRLMDDMSEALIEEGATPTDRAKIADVLGGTIPEPEIVDPPSGPKISISELVRTAIGSGASACWRTIRRRGSAPIPKRSTKRGSRRVGSDRISRRWGRCWIRQQPGGYGMSLPGSASFWVRSETSTC